jgi:hypothetical protein
MTGSTRNRCRPPSCRRCASWGWPATKRCSGQPLTGGVSSDIWRIDTARGPVCAKRALPKLRVAADWRAPIERNRYEARWMQVAQAARPGCTPQLLGQHPGLGVLVMQWLPPAEHRLWKALLHAGQADTGTAQAVGRTLARIHAHAAARSAELAPLFDSETIFFDIRLEPYLLATAQRHPTWPARCRPWWRRRRRTRTRWCTATSARRTSWSARRARCCWTPNAPAGATRPSTWPSA